MSSIEAKQFKLKSGEPALIRTASREDASSLLALAKSVMGESGFTLTEPDELKLSDEQEAEWIQGIREHPSKIIIVCEINGEIVGNLDFSNGHRRRIGHHGEFGMGVLKDWRGRGIGDMLLGVFLEWATANPKIEKVNLKVHATNKVAIHLYKKFGFEPEGLLCRDLKIGPDHYVDSVLMAKFVQNDQ